MLGGETQGFLIDFIYLPGGNAFNLFQRNLHLALGPNGDIDAFLRGLEPSLPDALRRDIDKLLVTRGREIGRLDAQLAFDLTRPDATARDWSRFAEAQHVRQLERVPLLDLP